MLAYKIDNGKPLIYFRNDAINSYVTALILQWQKASGSDHVLTKKSVKTKLEKTISSYYTNVYNKGHRKKSKHPLKNEAVCHIYIEIESNMETSDIVKIWTSNGKFVGHWEEHAPIDWTFFYEDQQTSQECRLSEEIDIEYTNEME